MYKRQTWIIADTHFSHPRMAGYCGRPQDFSERIRRHWNRMIQPNDLVYHLGDIFFGKGSQFQACVESLPGVKVLIKGNHDRKNTNWYLNRGFVAVLDFATVIVGTNVRKSGECLKYSRVLLSHKPMDIPNLGGYTTINIFGHFHNNPLEVCEAERVWLLTSHHYLFSLERTKYKPVLLDRAVIDGWVVPFDENTRQWVGDSYV